MSKNHHALINFEIFGSKICDLKVDKFFGTHKKPRTIINVILWNIFVPWRTTNLTWLIFWSGDRHMRSKNEVTWS